MMSCACGRCARFCGGQPGVAAAYGGGLPAEGGPQCGWVSRPVASVGRRLAPALLRVDGVMAVLSLLPGSVVGCGAEVLS